LILPPERSTARKLLVPYCGSGSEILGAMHAGWDEIIGIEREQKYIDIANRRIERWKKNA
jgi:DNA modification methylase